MTVKNSSGAVHKVPKDLKMVFSASQKVAHAWEDITPLAKNEWICWIESAKKAETRQKRISRLKNELPAGKRRPCCWAGCQHR